MITLSQIQKKYMKSVKRSFAVQIEKYISTTEVQELIKKAMDYSLERSDYRRLGEIGGHAGKYPHLYWLCCIHIHPLTIAQFIVTESTKIRL